MERIKTKSLTADADGVAEAVEIWRAGGLVAFPTETVYGLGADALNGKAVARIYAAKGRPSFNPLIIHVADLEIARRFAKFDRVAEVLAQAFWPGPLSLVLPVNPDSGLLGLVTAGLKTIAVRLPQNPLAQQLLAGFGGAIAAPSANISGRISPTSADHVLADLNGRIDAVIDGGKCAVGLESTILAPNHTPPALLRPGGLPVEVIEAALGTELALADDPKTPTSPGQMRSHYAPSVMVRMNVVNPDDGQLWLGFGPDCGAAQRNLSPAGDLHEAAANLFGLLHEMDTLARAGNAAEIAIAPVPDHGLGAAINDRLRRAAAPR